MTVIDGLEKKIATLLTTNSIENGIKLMQKLKLRPMQRLQRY